VSERTNLETRARIRKDSASYLASIGEIRERYWVFKRKARIGLTLVSKNEYFKSFFSMN
jgi:hypothetical protein